MVYYREYGTYVQGILGTICQSSKDLRGKMQNTLIKKMRFFDLSDE